MDALRGLLRARAEPGRSPPASESAPPLPKGHGIQTMAISLGLNLPYVEGSMDGRTPRWDDILAMAKAGEAVGFDALWISDHLGFGDPTGEWTGAWES